MELCGSPRGTVLVERIADSSGYSTPLLAASIEALLAPFLDSARLEAFAHKLQSRRDLIGFVMPGNIAGGGLHEVTIALLAGCGVLIKPATAEPCFFREFADAIARCDGAVGRRIAVLDWERDETALTAAMRECCDRIAVLGDDQTVATFDLRAANRIGRNDHLATFGERLSCALVVDDRHSIDSESASARMLARDIVLFEQRGCLSPHHVFVEDKHADGVVSVAFAARLASALERLACDLPPAILRLEDAVAIRSVRENARWRMLGGREVRLWEGSAFGWTVIFDRDSAFSASPGFRTIRVSPFSNLDDLAHRLEPVAARLEACSIAGFDRLNDETRALLQRSGATYLCEAGTAQSPPIEWLHGGGTFLRAFTK